MRKQNMKIAGIKGFSLTEMIIAVIILSVMSIFAIPNYFRSIEKQKERKAAAGVRQLGMAANAWRAATSSGSFSSSSVNTINSTLRTDLTLDTGEGVYVTVQQNAFLASYTLNNDAKIVGLGDTGGTVWIEPCCTTDNCLTLPDCP